MRSRRRWHLKARLKPRSFVRVVSRRSNKNCQGAVTTTLQYLIRCPRCRACVAFPQPRLRFVACCRANYFMKGLTNKPSADGVCSDSF
jgi:hypothetical protein